MGVKSVKILFAAPEGGVQCGIKDMGMRPGGTVAAGRAFHRAAIFEKENVGGLECEDVIRHGIVAFRQG
jgi:hypothetical protein